MSKLVSDGLTKSFGDLKVLENVHLTIEDGEFVALVGPSGCGKTTFLRTVAGLESADEGAIYLNEHQITGPGRDRGFVFQQDSLLPWRTVMENTVVGLELAGKLNGAEAERVRALLDLVGLGGFENYYPRQLSGGMRQRVNLARALAIDPKVLLMDEPFSALDAQTREIMQAELQRVWEEGRKTVLFVTHQIDEAVFLADRVLPRPRNMATKRRPEFVALVDRIWKLIEKDVRESVLIEKI